MRENPESFRRQTQSRPDKKSSFSFSGAFGLMFFMLVVLAWQLGPILYRGYQQSELLETGEKGIAKIISAEDLKNTVNDSRLFKIKITFLNMESPDVEFEQLVEPLWFSKLLTGQVVPVRFNAQNPEEIVIDFEGLAKTLQDTNEAAQFAMALPATVIPDVKPLVLDNVIYSQVLDKPGYLRAQDTKTGEELWTLRVHAEKNTYFQSLTVDPETSHTLILKTTNNTQYKINTLQKTIAPL